MSTPDPNPTTPPTASAFNFTEGQKLAGCYVLARRLATGDDAEVWLAHDEVLGKDVCLYFIPEAVRKDGRALPELRQELKRSRQLIHPNILRVYDLIEEPEWAAISTDAFEGESVAVLVTKQPGKHFAAADIQPWVAQLAQTIEEAHKINVLHRDLVPANLFLTPTGKLLVANFGISRVIQDALDRAGGAKSLHAAFASPQALDAQPPAKSDDTYSLGAVIYALLTGHPPFTGTDLPRQVREGVTPETLAALQKVDPAVPPAWQKAIAASLEKNPEARPPSAAELGRLLTSEALSAAAPAIASAAEIVPVPKAEPEIIKAPAEPPTAKPEPEAPAPLVKPEPKSDKPLTIEPVKPPQERKTPVELAPRLYPEESRFPTTGLAIAAGLILVIAIIYHFAGSQKSSNQGYASATPPPEKAELRVVSNPTPPPPVVTTSPKPSANPVGSTPKPATPAIAAATPIKAATPPGVDKALADKAAALEKAKQNALAAEKAHADLLKQQQQAEVAVADAQKLIAEKTKAVEPLKKAADEALAQRKKLEEDEKTADAAATEAQKVAAEKARLAEELKKTNAETDKKNQEKVAAQQKAEAELETLKTTLADKQRLAADAAKAISIADAEKQAHLAAITKSEQEIAAANAAAADEQRKLEAEAVERRKVEQEIADMKNALQAKLQELENKQKALANPGTPPPDAPKLPEKTPTPPASTPAPQPPVAPSTKAATPEPMKLANIPATPAPLPPPATPAPLATGENTNSLGQKFVPVGEVEFCIWQTRIKDFEAFAKAVNLKSSSWKSPGFKQGPDHPVVNVTWLEAVAFCKWLTDKEHKDGVLPAQQFYRLPTDLEWSAAVGLPTETGKTPEARDMGVPDIYPWGTAWPPPVGAGNYTGEETGSDVAIKGYDDGFAWTSPVGSFPPNKLGIYDMGGNVWQWCMDGWNNDSKAKVLRGASWYNGALKLSLLSSCRVHAAPDNSTDNYGFRIVRASEVVKSGKK